MTKKKILKTLVISVVAVIAIGAGTALYLFNMPHRDVQSTDTDFKTTASLLEAEYLSDQNAANAKYLDNEGDSKVLEVEGMISSITEDFNGQKVVLLKSTNDKAGVSCTFLEGTDISQLQTGKTIAVKGVVRAGAAYDEDLEMYEPVILQDCALLH